MDAAIFPMPTQSGRSGNATYGACAETALPSPSEPPTFACEICAAKVPFSGIAEATCPSCGTLYGYEEGYSIILSEEQLALLRDAAKSK